MRSALKRLLVGLLPGLLISLGALVANAQSLADMPPPPPAPVRPTPTPTPAPTPEKEPEIDKEDVVRVSTNLITVPAEVVDRNGRYVGTLKKDDFRIYENGVEQELAYFASVEQPITVALLLDVSGSTQSQLQSIRLAANSFIKRLRANDRLLLVSFDGRINVLTEPVTLAELRRQNKIRLDALHEGTLLYDAVGFTLNQRLAGITGRKALVLMTDGVDNGSKSSSLRQNLRDAERGDVIIYTVQYNTLPQLPARLATIENVKAREHVRERMLKEYSVGSNYLQSLAAKTGGSLYKADDLVDLPNAFSAITEELGRQYSLGYYPKTEAEPGEKRDIQVRTRTPNLMVRARDSYTTVGAVRNQQSALSSQQNH